MVMRRHHQGIVTHPAGKVLVYYLVAATALLGVSPREGVAALAPTALAAAEQGTGRAEDLACLQSLLEQKQVAQRLAELGFSAEEIRARLEALDDQRLHEVAQRVDALVAAGAGDPASGLAGAAVVAFYVVLGALYLVAYSFVGLYYLISWIARSSSAPEISTAAPETPTVAITAPTSGQTVSGNVLVTVSVSAGVVGVRYLLDWEDIRSEVTTAPFAFNWPTTLASDGPHTLAATARDAAGNTTTSSGVIVTVDNSAPTEGVAPPEGEGWQAPGTPTGPAGNPLPQRGEDAPKGTQKDDSATPDPNMYRPLYRVDKCSATGIGC